MVLGELIKLAFNTLAANKTRAFLTMLGISIGVAAVIALMSIGAGVQEYITQQFASAGANLIGVVPGRIQRGPGGGAFGAQAPLTMSDYRAVAANVANVLDTSADFARPSVFAYGDNTSEVNVTGVMANFSAIRNWNARSGRMIDESDVAGRSRVVALGQTVVNDLFEPGEDPIGKVVRINNVPFRVIGVMESKGASFLGDQDAVAFIPITTAQERLFGQQSLSVTGERTISTIYLQAPSKESVPSVMAQVDELLRERRRIPADEPSDFSVLSQDELINTFGAVTGVLTVFLGAIAAISLLVGGIGIMNIMLVSVTERTREIGLRKAIGAKPSAILTQFLTEAVFLSLIGGLVGIAVGVGGAMAISRFAEFQPVVQVSTIVLAVGFSIAVGLFFGIYPARRAARLNPIEALRFE
ncbi:MAG: ABC transporter permease [Anaerolineae bacterium]|nr:ABC transporter permease [Thermoflexales bacterium]MDW8407598.1 ABC transporter permease [Anaerolineae bacterium]